MNTFLILFVGCLVISSTVSVVNTIVQIPPIKCFIDPNECDAPGPCGWPWCIACPDELCRGISLADPSRAVAA